MANAMEGLPFPQPNRIDGKRNIWFQIKKLATTLACNGIVRPLPGHLISVLFDLF